MAFSWSSNLNQKILKTQIDEIQINIDSIKDSPACIDHCSSVDTNHKSNNFVTNNAADDNSVESGENTSIFNADRDVNYVSVDNTENSAHNPTYDNFDDGFHYFTVCNSENSNNLAAHYNGVQLSKDNSADFAN